MAIGDQYFDKVVFASNFDAAFSDESSAFPKATGLAGNAAISATQSKFGGKALYLDGTGDYAYVANSADFDFGSGDFTVEGWFYPTVITGTITLFGKRASNTNYAPFVVYITQSGKLSAEISYTGTTWGATPASVGVVFTANTWHHVALVRDGLNIYGYVNGVQAFSAAVSTNVLFANGAPLNIGGDQNTNYFTGYVDSFRVTKGYCRYPAGTTFSVPTAAFPMYAAQLQGTVKDANGNFARRLVKSHRRADGLITDAVLSNPSDGTFTLKTRDTSKHYAVVHDSDAWITYLPFNGDNNSTLFYEWGGKSVTAYGNAKISTTQSKFGGSSLYLDGTGDLLVIPASSDLTFGTGDFTVECWINPTVVSNKIIVDGRPSGYVDGPVFYITSTGKIGCVSAPNNVEKAGTSTLSSGVWTHLAWVRSSGVLTMYVNGVQEFSGDFAFQLNGYPVCIGGDLQATACFQGYIDDLRISKGVARYVGTFTPPTAPHFTVQEGDPWWNNVVLGCHFDGQPDNGDQYRNSVVLNMRGNTLTEDTGKVVTAYGNAAVATVSGRTAFGGKALSFDGAGDYLQIPYSSNLDFGTGDFTVEAWINVVAYSTATANICGTYSYGSVEGGSLNSGWMFGLNPNGTLNFGVGLSGTWNNIITGATPVGTGVWKHVSVTRSGTTVKLFIDGVADATATSSLNITQTKTVFNVGSRSDVGTYGPAMSYNGFIDDLRVTKGIARYTGSTYTVPTAEIPALQRSFPDVSGGKVLTANGDVKIVSTQSKFNGYSAYFDGSGDYLSIPASTDFDFGAGDFAIDFWIRMGAMPTSFAPIFDQWIAGSGSYSTGQWQLIVSSTGELYIAAATSASASSNSGYTTGAAISTSAFKHVAVSRVSGVITIYVDGVSIKTWSFAGAVGLSGSAVRLGYQSNSQGEYLNAYVDDLRVTKGVGRFNGAYTPPTAAFLEQLQTYGQQNALIYDHLTPV